MKQSMVPAFALLVFVCMGCGKKRQADTPVEQFEVRTVDLRDAIVQTGEVKPVVKVDLQSEASGRIEKVYVREGQWVAKGDMIITIDPSRLRFSKDRLDLAVKKAAIQRDLAKRDFDDSKKLVETGTVSERHVVDLESSLKLAEIAYSKELLEFNDIVDQLSKTKVASPMDGIITDLNVEEGEIAVSATSGFQKGTTIATIADVSRLEVVSQIGEVDYVHLSRGQSVLIRPETIEGSSTTGTIDFVALSAKRAGDEELGTFEVRVTIDSLIPGIAPGINVNVEFVILEKKGVLGVPSHFVKKTPRGSIVMVAPGPGAKAPPKPREVELGATDFRHVEVLSGLKEGEVILYQADAGLGGPPGAKGKKARGSGSPH